MTSSFASRTHDHHVHAAGMPRTPRRYRLVDGQGEHHPVLDDLYETLDAAWEEAMRWWSDQAGSNQEAVGIGVEVSTPCGGWRTLRHPGC
jgi:hypothetical protein